MKRLLMPIFVLLIAMALLIPSVGYCADKGVIKIGFLAPLTGPFAAEGKKMVDGAKFAISQINKPGGLLGKKVELVVYDIGYFKPELIVGGAKKLVLQDKVAMVSTGYLGGVTDIKALGQYDVPYIHSDTSHLAAKAVMDKPDKYWNVFQVSPEEVLVYRDALYHLIVNTPWKFPNKKIAIITMDRAYNRKILNANKDSFKKDISKVAPGWEIVIDEMMPTGTTEWGPILSKIRSAKPSVILFNNHVITDEASFMKQFLRDPTQSLVGMIYGPQNPDFLKLAGPNAQGVLWDGGGNKPAPTKEGKKLVADFKKEIGIEPPSLSLLVWAGIKIWADSVRAVGDERKYFEVCRYIKGGNWRLPEIISTYVFDQHTQTVLVGHGLFVNSFIQIQNGRNVVITPKVHATGTFQLPPWIKK